MSTVKNGLREGEELLTQVKLLSVPLIESLDSEGRDKVAHDIQQLANELKESRNTVKDSEDLLSRCIASWDSFTTILDALKNWEKATLTKVRPKFYK